MKKITSNDIKLLNMLRITGACDKEQLKEFISDRRLKAMVKEGFLQPVKYTDNGTFKDAYVLTGSSKNFIQNDMGERLYHSQSPQHDVALSREYLKLSESERERCYTEYETRYNNNDKFSKNDHSAPDFSYVSDSGELTFVDVITSNYTKEQVQAKANYAAASGAKFVPSKA